MKKQLMWGLMVGVSLLAGTCVFAGNETKVADKNKDKEISVSEKEMMAFLEIYPKVKSGKLKGNDFMTALTKNNLTPADFTALTNKISQAYACCKVLKMKEAVLKQEKNREEITESENLKLNGENVSLSRNAIELVNKYLPQLESLFETEKGNDNKIQEQE
jgi:hypothetical protein